MKHALYSLIALVTLLNGTTMKLQLVNNSPNQSVDVYINNQNELRDFDYQNSSASLDVPSSLEIGIAPVQGSIDSDFTIELEPRSSNIGIISGSIGNSDSPLEIFTSVVNTSSVDREYFAVKFFNGANDLSSVDIVVNDNILINDLEFGRFSDYNQLLADIYNIQIKDSETGSRIEEYILDVSQSYGETGIIYTSGYLNPDNTSPPFSVVMVDVDGQSISLPASNIVLDQHANVQIIHNSPYPTVDIYVDGVEALGDVAYRATTGLLELPISTTVGIAPANGDVIAEFPFTLVSGGNYVVTASGIVGDTNHPFDLVASTLDTVATDVNHFALKVYHGVTDAPAVDIYANGSLLVDNLSYGDYAGYVQVPVGDYTIDVAAHGSTTPVASFSAPLTGLGGGAGVVFASGFLAPTNTDSAFTLILTTPSGYDVELPAANPILGETANVQIIHNSPYPTVDIYVDGVEALGDVAYRATTGLLELPISTTVGIAPANGDVIAEFPFTLVSGGNYVVTASGIVGDTNHPFDLVASTLDTVATDVNHFALKVYHGVTDAPAVDIYANGSLLVDNLSYGDYAGYVQVPVGDYTIDVAAHGSTTPVASFSAPLTGLGGGAGVVFASGFLAPTNTDSAFTLILTTPSGYDVELPAAQTALSTSPEVIINPSSFALKQNYPNPFNPSTMIGFEIFKQSNVEVKVFDMNGKFVKSLLSRSLSSGAYNIEWNGKNNEGMSVAGGVYLYSITADGQTSVKKMSLIK